MAFNSIVRKASIRSVGYQRQSHGAFSVHNVENTCVAGLQFLESVRFSTVTNKNHACIPESFLGRYPGEDRRPFEAGYPLDAFHIDDDSKVVLCRNYKHGATKLEVFGDTCKVIDGIPNVSIQATVDRKCHRGVHLEIEATAQPSTIRIHRLQINTIRGNLVEFHQHLGSKGIDLIMVRDLFDFFRKQSKK